MVVSNEFTDIQVLEFEKGRFYTESESNAGRPVVVIGSEIAKSLFGDFEPIGKKVRLYGQKFTVIGVVKKEGSGLFGDSNDESIFLPVNYVRKRFGDNNKNFRNIIIIQEISNYIKKIFMILKWRIAFFNQKLSKRGHKSLCDL